MKIEKITTKITKSIMFYAFWTAYLIAAKYPWFPIHQEGKQRSVL